MIERSPHRSRRVLFVRTKEMEAGDFALKGLELRVFVHTKEWARENSIAG